MVSLTQVIRLGDAPQNKLVILCVASICLIVVQLKSFIVSPFPSLISSDTSTLTCHDQQGQTIHCLEGI